MHVQKLFFLNLCHVLPREPGNTRVLNSDEVKGIKTNMKMKLETKKKRGFRLRDAGRERKRAILKGGKAVMEGRGES